MQYVYWLVWFSPCLLPVALVAGLCIAALVRQAKADRDQRDGPENNTDED